MTPVLRTQRLVFKPYVPADEDHFVTLFQDEEVSRHVGDGRQSEAEDRTLFGRVFDVYADNRFDVWAVWRDDEYVGHAEIKPSPSDDVDGHELIYILAKSEWRKGLGTELAQRVCSYGFDELGLDRIYATVDVDNTRSLALLERLGFRQVRDRTNDDGHTTRILVRDR